VANTSELDGNDKGRGGRTSLGVVGELELVRVIWNDHAQEEDSQAVEEQDSVEGQLDGTGNRLAGILGLANRYTNQLSSEVGEDGIDQRRPEAVEPASVASVDVLLESAWVLVVFETGRLSIWSGTDCEEER
jgi:hypothetical protein